MHRKQQLISPARVLCLLASLGIHSLLLRTGRWISSPAQIELAQGQSSVELTLRPSVASTAHEPESQPPPPLPIEQPRPPLPIEQPLPPPVVETPEPEEPPVIKPPAEQAEPEKPSAPAEDNNADLKPKGIESSAVPEIPRSPVYPHRSRQRGEQGTVVVSLTVTVSGKAEQVAVKKSSGYPLLDQAALAAIRKSRFRPALHNGLAVNSSIEQVFIFILENEK